jgi:hypothetical protein
MNDEFGNHGLITRRDALKTVACGFGHLALAGMVSSGAGAQAGIQAPKFRQSHHPPRAKRILFLFMQGGPSHIDTFDHKSALEKYEGKMVDFDDARTIANTGERKGTPQRVMRSPWGFQRYGECGQMVSELFPEMARHVDDLCFIKSLHTEGVAHGPATLFLHCGSTNLIRPSMGSWVHYGLGSLNQNLPGFVTICPSTGNGGARNYGSAFLPPIHQGTALGTAGGPVSEALIRNLHHPSLSAAQQRSQFELMRELSQAQAARRPGDREMEAVIESMELAWRMQQNAPDTLDLSQESPSTLALYGIGDGPTDAYGRQCLMARRLCEAGVRYIQVTYGDNSANPAWDQHSNLGKHADHARAVDKPIAGLLTDLKRRGLLDDTLVWWGSEFGRTPYAEKNGTGRDHNPGGFTVWLAGGGVRAGYSHGATDDFGHQAVQGRVHMHDLHATLLHQLGLDHERLTYRHDGRDFRLTDVRGRVVHEILA